MMGFTTRQQRLLLLLAPVVLCITNGFAPFVSVRQARQAAVRSTFFAKKYRNEGEVGRGSNWIERSLPVGVTGGVQKVDDYNLGISGESFGTGDLSKRMYDAIMSANFQDGMGDEIKRAFTLYAMDFTAKEATKAALKTNGLEMVVEEDMEDEGMWGEVDSVQLLDESGEPVGPLYDSTEEAVDRWTPGQSFNFIVRQVPAKKRELTLEELMQALDPNGELREQAAAANLTLPDENINSLQDLARDVARRTEFAPREATTEINAFAGLDKRGYRVISRGDLSRDSVNADGSENQITLMHVMDALVSHGALVVDLTDGGTTYQLATRTKEMWDTTEKFFDTLESDPELEDNLPGMTSVVGRHAKVGYGNYDNGSMQFMETRWERDGGLLPSEAKEVLGEEDLESLKRAFDTVCEVGKDVVRIVTAAAGMDADVFPDDEGDVLASQAATLLVDELVDNGKPLGDTDVPHEEGPISMSPQRLCRYANNNKDEDEDAAREVFGAHTDSSFITAVPVAAVSGLEVYDEAEERWFRPELAARLHWQQERAKRGEDPSADAERLVAVDDDQEDTELAWYARYVVLMPGEFLQIVSRNEVPAAVHRVVAVREGPARISTPILLRGRPGTKLDVGRYLGAAGDSRLLEKCNGMSMDEIHSAMQPSSYQ
jgi:hypothetical protein